MIKRASFGVFILGWTLLYTGNRTDNDIILLLSVGLIIGGLAGLIYGAKNTNWNKFPLNKL